MTSPVGIGVIGAGTISDTYLENLTNFADTEVLAVGDLVTEASREKAAKYDVAAAGDVATVLDHPDIEIVVNLTIPAAHAEVATNVIGAGKHVWNEKPLALDRVSGQTLLRDAQAAGLLVGCAPDTFLGQGLQTACQLIEQGLIPVRGWRWPAIRPWALLPHSARAGLRISFLGRCAWFEGQRTAGDRLWARRRI